MGGGPRAKREGEASVRSSRGFSGRRGPRASCGAVSGGQRSEVLLLLHLDSSVSRGRGDLRSCGGLRSAEREAKSRGDRTRSCLPRTDEGTRRMDWCSPGDEGRETNL